MTSAKLRLGLAIIAFGVWMGWLIRLAVTANQSAWPESTPDKGLRNKPIVLSRPQFLISNLDVVADVKKLNQEVSILEVLWPASEAQKWQDKTARIANLQDCEDSWPGGGAYIVPLMKGIDDRLRVAPLPRSPGSPGRRESKDGQVTIEPVRIYPATPETRRQEHQIKRALALP
jgi:hypothetical protein